MKYYLAVDVGASSGRHILGHVEDGRIVLEEMYRFDTLQVRKNGHDCWDTDGLWQNILNGLKACGAAGKVPDGMGIDTWAVDFVLLDGRGRLVGDAVAYRDRRTEGMDAAVNQVLGPSELYARTGIQKQIFNTIYQLMALKREHPEQLSAARSFLMIPEYFNFLLTGARRNEYTNATSTNLVNARRKTWDRELIGSLGLPEDIFGPLAMPGTPVGHFTEAVRKEVGFDCEVLLPATHDTGSAFLAVPAKDDRSVCLSSGTWSLLGVETAEPITTEASRLKNFTNEGGYGYRFRYLKNIMGLWMVQSIRRELNGVSYVKGGGGLPAGKEKISFDELETAARAADRFESIVDVNDGAFLAPDSMAEAVRENCRKTRQAVPATVGELMRCVYRSLAECYAKTVDDLSRLTGGSYTGIHIVGGGSKDGYLNELTARAAGLPVYAGPSEATALGNLMVQMIAGGEFPDLAAARKAVRNSFPIKEIGI